MIAHREFARPTLAAAWRQKRLWLLQVFGNAALLAATWGWLWIPEAHAWQVAATLVVAAVILALSLWLHGGTLALFHHLHHGGESPWAAFGATRRRLPALAVWGLIFGVLMWVVDWLHGEEYHVAAWLSSALTLWLGRPVTPRLMSQVYYTLVFFLGWVLALFLVALAVRVATQGFAGFRPQSLRRALSAFWRFRYWVTSVAAFALGAFLPWFLANWKPVTEGVKPEAVSLGLRFLAAYLLMMTAWVVLASAAARVASSLDQ